MYTDLELFHAKTRPKKFFAYFNNKQYEKNMAKNGIFWKTTEGFTPVPDIITNMSAFIMGTGIKFGGSHEKLLGAIWENNKSDIKIHDQLLPWLLGTQKCVIEIIPRDPFPIIKIHDWDCVEIKKNDDEIIYCKIKGEIEVFDYEKNEFLTKQIIKEFWNIEGKRFLQETIDDKKGNPIPLPGSPNNPVIPIVEIETNYNIEPVFNLTDSWNEKQAYIDNINWEHGEPFLQGREFDEIPKSQKELTEKEAKKARTMKDVKTGRHGEQKATYVGKGWYEYVEYTTHMEKSMLEDQKKIIEIVKTMFPESDLSDVFKDANISYETLMLKFTVFAAKLDPIKNNLADGFRRVNKIVLLMQGIVDGESEIIFPEIFTKSTKDALDELNLAVAMGLLTPEFILENNMIPQLIRDPAKMLKALKEMREAEKLKSSLGMFGDEDDNT